MGVLQPSAEARDAALRLWDCEGYCGASFHDIACALDDFADEVKENGCAPKHDSDCLFWSWKLCTCGLLLRLVRKSRPDAEYSEFWEEKAAHDFALERLFRRPGAPKAE